MIINGYLQQECESWKVFLFKPTSKKLPVQKSYIICKMIYACSLHVSQHAFYSLFQMWYSTMEKAKKMRSEETR